MFLAFGTPMRTGLPVDLSGVTASLGPNLASIQSALHIQNEETATAPLFESNLGRFLETDIAARIERVSGKTWTKAGRISHARAIAAAVSEASYEFGLDPFLLIGMMEVESRYNTMAVGTHGELGLLQIKPTTALWITPNDEKTYGCDLHQVRCNVHTGARYISHLLARTERVHGQTEGTDIRLQTLRSYNQGPARADRTPAGEVTEAGASVPYAVRIAWRADQMRKRFLVFSTTNQVVTELAMAQ